MLEMFGRLSGEKTETTYGDILQLALESTQGNDVAAEINYYGLKALVHFHLGEIEFCASTAEEGLKVLTVFQFQSISWIFISQPCFRDANDTFISVKLFLSNYVKIALIFSRSSRNLIQLLTTHSLGIPASPNHSCALSL